MTALKYLLMILGLGLFGSTGALVAYDIFLSEQLRRLVPRRRGNTLESHAMLPAVAQSALTPGHTRAA